MRNPDVEQAVRDELKDKLPAYLQRPGALLRLVSGKVLPRSDVISITVHAESPDLAAAVAAAWGRAYQRHVNALYVTSGIASLSDLEQEAFGWTHAEAGAMMANSWKLPASFGEMIAGHIELNHCLKDRGAKPGVVAVALSAHLPSASEETWSDRDVFADAFHRLARPGFPTPVEMLAQVDEEFNEFAPVLKVAQPAHTLVELYEATAAEATA
ncbi:MAG: HDOD domain-containing protein [Planctomycetes bacterium]|nr:HDOD domain-containing protein [Planctomycetota bacterium]